MNTQSQPPASSRSPVINFFRWLFTWPGIRRMLIVFGWMVAIIALFYGIENWRGKRAWNQYRQQLEARGAQLDWNVFIPKPLPEDQNFAAIPLIKSWFIPGSADKNLLGTNYDAVSVLVAKQEKKGVGRRLTDLVVWKEAYEAVRTGQTNNPQTLKPGQLDAESRAKAAPAVLEALKSGSLDELRAASHRPLSQYPVAYNKDNPWGIMLPHLGKLRHISTRLQIEASAELAAGRSDKALEDVKMILYLADSLKDEPILISYLVRLLSFQAAAQVIWEGLAEHRWNEAQLLEIQTRLQGYNFLEDSQKPLMAERAAGVLTVDIIRKNGKLSELIDIGNFGEPQAPRFSMFNVLARIMPGGWYSMEQLNYCRLFSSQLGGIYDPAKGTVSPAVVAANMKELERQLAGGHLGKGFNAIFHHQLVATQLVPALGGIYRKGAAAQVVADQAIIACALERYRLAHNQFPDTLDALRPQFITQLPNDVLSGEPYKYQRTADGQFVLYSVGWNEKDDGGSFWQTLFNEKQGDWVWQYAEK